LILIFFNFILFVRLLLCCILINNLLWLILLATYVFSQPYTYSPLPPTSQQEGIAPFQIASEIGEEYNIVHPVAPHGITEIAKQKSQIVNQKQF
jgi:hypothetical protein